MGTFLRRYRLRVLLGSLTLTFLGLVVYPKVFDQPRIKVYDLWKVPAYDVHPMQMPSLIHRERRKLIHTTCKHHKTSSRALPDHFLPEIMTLKTPPFSYCAAPAAGYTKWLRLLRYLISNTTNSILETDYEIHNKGAVLYKQLLKAGQDRRAVLNSVRVLTARDPYTRVWSVYMDKLLLPDFWLSVGTKIVQATRPNVSPLSAKCGHDVTFPEFINYVLKHHNKSSIFSESKYWLPVSDLCDPCRFKPDIISKYESLSSDVNYILGKLQVENKALSINFKDNTEWEIQNIIDYNFRLYPKVKECISDKYEFCKRLWTAFILDGLIPPDETFPTNIYHDSLNKESFYELVKNVRDRHNITDSDMLARKEHARATAYNQIPKEHMNAFKQIFERDFNYFGYDASPKYLQQ